MHALLLRHEIPKYLLSRTAYNLRRTWWSVSLAPLYLVQLDAPVPTRPGWVQLRVRLSGICGSDLSTLTGSESLYLEPEATFPFVPGHEIVGEIEDLSPDPDRRSDGLHPGDRVGIWPVLGCVARNLEPCKACAGGWEGLCERRKEGWPGSGLSIGFNRDTGGGWSQACLAHRSQLWKLPDAISDEEAVFLDPAASSLAAILRTEQPDTERTLIIGGGTIGLLAAYLHQRLGLAGACHLIVRHDFQKKWAVQNGIRAFVVRSEEAFLDWASDQNMQSQKVTGYGRVFRGNYDRVVVAAGSNTSIKWALRSVRPKGRIALLTAPAALRGFDPTPLWYREIALHGIYVYGPIPWQQDWVHPYEILLDGLQTGQLSFRSLLTHQFLLSEYRKAIDTALSRSGTEAIKVAFRPN